MLVKDPVESRSNDRPSICVCINLRRASRAITRIYDKALEPSNLKLTQYSVLVNLMASGPISVSNLSHILKLDRTTLVRNLKTLESAGFTENSATAAADPRERLIVLSESGRRAVELARPYWQAVQEQVQDHLGREHLEQLRALVTALEGYPGA